MDGRSYDLNVQGENVISLEKIKSIQKTVSKHSTFSKRLASRRIV